MSRLVAIVWILATVGPAVAQPAAAEGPRVVVTQPDESKFPEITVYFELKRPDGTFELGATRALAYLDFGHSVGVAHSSS